MWTSLRSHVCYRPLANLFPKQVCQPPAATASAPARISSIRESEPAECSRRHTVTRVHVTCALTMCDPCVTSTSHAGGSAANTTRTLAGFDVATKLIGARGLDEVRALSGARLLPAKSFALCACAFTPLLLRPPPPPPPPLPSNTPPTPAHQPPDRPPQWGALFNSAMKRSGVDVSQLVTKTGPTGRSCILSCRGQRTMRTCLAGCPRIEAADLQPHDFRGVQWVFVSACEQGGGGLCEAPAEA